MHGRTSAFFLAAPLVAVAAPDACAAGSGRALASSVRFDAVMTADAHDGTRANGCCAHDMPEHGAPRAGGRRS